MPFQIESNFQIKLYPYRDSRKSTINNSYAIHIGRKLLPPYSWNLGCHSSTTLVSLLTIMYLNQLWGDTNCIYIQYRIWYYPYITLLHQKCEYHTHIILNHMIYKRTHVPWCVAPKIPMFPYMVYRSIYPLCYAYLVHSKNNSYFVEIKLLLKKYFIKPCIWWYTFSTCTQSNGWVI